MNNVMTSSFCELNENDMMMVDGGKIDRDSSFLSDVGYVYGQYYNFAYGFGGYVQQNGGVKGMLKTAYDFYTK